MLSLRRARVCVPETALPIYNNVLNKKEKKKIFSVKIPISDPRIHRI